MLIDVHVDLQVLILLYRTLYNCNLNVIGMIFISPVRCLYVEI